jgi:nicotinate dehydrogenase subunit B
MAADTLPRSLEEHPWLDEWLSLETPGRVRVNTGKVEIGQGILTALAQIAADELDVAFESVDIVSGRTDDAPNEYLTAGSLSVEVSGRSIQLAAALARHKLLAVAARRLAAVAGDLTISDGAILKDGRSTNLDIWLLSSEVDWHQKVAGDIAAKPPAERRVIGRAVPRLDLPSKIRGSAFIHDLDFAGMKHARVIRRPTLFARLTSLDETRFRAEFPKVEIVRQHDFIAVLGDNEHETQRAVEFASALARWENVERIPVTQGLRDWLQGHGSVATTVIATGNGIAGPRRFEAVFTRPFIAHASIGPSCAIASFVDSNLRVWTHSQGVFPLRQQLARVLTLDIAQISVVHVQGAGCYGHNGADDVALDAALIAMARPGRPVRVQWTRRDEFQHAPCGAGMVVRLQAQCDEAGQVTDWRHEIWSSPHNRRPGSGGGPNLLAAEALSPPWPRLDPEDVPLVAGGGATRNAEPLYDFPNRAVFLHGVRQVAVRSSALRSLGAHANIFAVESFMDELANAFGRDSLDWRLAHLRDPRARQVLTRVTERSGWKDAPRQESRAQGLAWARYKNHAAYCAIVAEVTAGENIRVERIWCAVDAGAIVNPDGVCNQIEGGIIQATSWTLKEALDFDDAGITTENWDGYPILRFSEVPDIDIELIEAPELPMLGVGEAAQGPTSAAIGNAVANALSLRVRDLPLTRDRLVAAMLDPL